jgi:hypothetical protein
MPESTIVCPRCDARIRVTVDKYFFTVVRNGNNRPVEMRVMEDGKVRHACSMLVEPRVQTA